MLTPEQVKKYRMQVGLDPETAEPIATRNTPAPTGAPTRSPAPAPVQESPETRIKRLRGEIPDTPMATEPEKPGLLRSLAKGLLDPFARAGVSAYNIASAGGDLFQAALAPKGQARQDFINKAGENITKRRNVPILGELSAVGSEGDTLTGIKDILGTGAEIASTIVGGGEAKGALEAGNVLRKGAWETAKRGLRYGAGTSALYSAGDSLTKDQDLGDTLKNTAIGAAVGAPLGAVGELAAPAISKTLQRGLRYVKGEAAPVVERAAANAVTDAAQTAAKPGITGRIAKTIAEPFSEGSGYAGRTARRVTQAVDEKAQVAALKPVEQEAIKVGIQKPDIEFLNTASPNDRKVFKKMIDVDETGRTARRATERPTGIAGETIINRVKTLEKVNDQAGKALGAAVEKFPDQPIDITDKYQAFKQGLENRGIKVTKNGKLDFKDTSIAGVSGSKDRELLQMMHDDLRPNRAGQVTRNPKVLYRIRQKFFNDLNLAKASDSVGSAEGLLRKTYSDLATPLDAIGDAMQTGYKENRIKFAQTRDALDEFHKLMGTKWAGNLDESAKLRAGEVANRILGNASASPLKTLNMIDELVKKLGYNDGMSVSDQVVFADYLEKLFGTTQTRGLRGQVGSGVGDALETGQHVLGGNLAALAKKGAELVNKVTPEERRRVLRLLLEKSAKP